MDTSLRKTIQEYHFIKYCIAIYNNTFFQYILIILAVLLPQGLCALKAVPYSTYDEIGPLKFLAYITGYNEGLAMSVTSYYGWGTYIWMAPVCFFTDNPIIIYRVCVFWSCILQTMCALITYKTCKQYLIPDKPDIYSLFISIMVGYICFHDLILFNEHGLLLINCIVLYFICKAFSDVSRTSFYIFVAFLFSFYSLTMHTRAIILVIAISFVCVFFYLFFRTRLLKKNHIVLLLLIGVGTFLLVKFMQNKIWITQAAEVGANVYNISINVGRDKLNYIFTAKFWHTIWIYVFGQIYASNVVMGGSVVLILFVFGIYIYKLIIKKMDIKKLSMQKDIFVFFTFGICVVSLLVGVGINWGAPIYRDLADIYGAQSSALKGIHYTRYSMTYMVPLAVLSLSLSLDGSLCTKKCKLFWIIIQGIMFKYWYVTIYPKVRNEGTTIDYLLGVMRRKPYTGIPYENFIKVIVVSLGIICVSFLIGKQLIYYVFVMGIAIYSFMGSFYCDTNAYQIIRSEYQRASYAFLNEKLSDAEFDEIEEMYAYNVDWLREQFYISKTKIVGGLPQENKEEMVVMYQGNYGADTTFLELIDLNSFKIYEIQKNCYLMVKGEKYQSFFEN